MQGVHDVTTGPSQSRPTSSLDGLARAVTNSSGHVKNIENCDFSETVCGNGILGTSERRGSNAHTMTREGCGKLLNPSGGAVDIGSHVAIALQLGDVDQACSLIPCLRFMSES